MLNASAVKAGCYDKYAAAQPAKRQLLNKQGVLLWVQNLTDVHYSTEGPPTPDKFCLVLSSFV